MPATHEVLNQPPPLQDWNPFEQDPVLRDALDRYAVAWAEGQCRDFGALVGSAEVLRWAVDANRFLPELRTHDRFGHRIDEVEYHPAWHQLMSLSFGWGLHSLGWEEGPPGGNVARTVLFLLMAQAELGHGCPVSMAWSVIPTLRLSPGLSGWWEPRILSRSYDPRPVPPEEKDGLVVGMTLTEKQGGSDLRANTTVAVPVGDGEYRLTGHKWFCSAPMCDAFVVTARAPEGLSVFLVPRWVGGERNTFRLQRLKDKLGNRSNASSEVEFEDTRAFLVGEAGSGVKAVLPMLHRTRFDCIVGSTALMRQSVSQAAWHVRHRHAFGKRLVDQPLMTNVVADLALESEAAMALALRLASAFDVEGDAVEEAFRRIALSVGKYWVCKRSPGVVTEALECHGGNGYVEEWPMARLYREAPLYGIWEGTGNVIALDVLRALAREPETGPAFLAELDRARGLDDRYDAAVDELESRLGRPDEAGARRLVERMGVVLQAGLLLRHAPQAIAEAFLVTRLAGDHLAYGTLPSAVGTAALLERIPSLRS